LERLPLPHRIVVFIAGSSLCREIVDEIEAGKCARCELTVYNISDHTALAEKYGVRVAPTVIIDEEVKIEGRPDIRFVCTDET
jgi:protein-disulfide isomerase